MKNLRLLGTHCVLQFCIRLYKLSQFHLLQRSVPERDHAWPANTWVAVRELQASVWKVQTISTRFSWIAIQNRRKPALQTCSLTSGLNLKQTRTPLVSRFLCLLSILVGKPQTLDEGWVELESHRSLFISAVKPPQEQSTVPPVVNTADSTVKAPPKQPVKVDVAPLVSQHVPPQPSVPLPQQPISMKVDAPLISQPQPVAASVTAVQGVLPPNLTWHRQLWASSWQQC